MEQTGGAGRALITVVGLGPGTWDLMSVRAQRCLEQAAQRGHRLVLRTRHHPVADELARRGWAFTTLDDHYERYATFDEVYAAMARTLLALAREGPVVYGVPGHPLVGERSVVELLEQAARAGKPAGDGDPGRRVGAGPVQVQVVPSPGGAGAAWAALGIDPLQVGAALVDAHELARWAGRPEKLAPACGRAWERTRAYLVLQLDSQLVAQEVKAVLGGVFGDAHRVALVRAAGAEGGSVRWMELHELDRAGPFDPMTALYVPPGEAAGGGEWVEVLVRIMAALRGPQGCPWDRQQTALSLRRYLIEESYEAVAAIERGDTAALRDELGDVLLQVVFQAQLGFEEGQFDLAGVARGLQEKLVRRHPHVFGETRVRDAAEVLQRWEDIKERERAERERAAQQQAAQQQTAQQQAAQERAGQEPAAQGRGAQPDGTADASPPGEGQPRRSLMDGLTMQLPSLALAEAVQRRAARVGFEWPEISGAGTKAVEEARELREAWFRRDAAAVHREMGDLLFALVNVARYMHVDPELALRDATLRFVERFRRMEAMAAAKGVSLQELSLAEQDELWEQAKQALQPRAQPGAEPRGPAPA
ncbi:MAG TPA: nucleoside triphosphate pyrophosphohydrolase [Limnochordales bacterium]